ncbi:hypothetical protein RHGRI_015058 [Rhododendron griersonianum]|uniref:RRM domain-containing protein n=1 Tax=Rhododendron griersonianum TaxID=479676 RepID=A0AAV6KBU7_9ERIC|nr:hypothetical protein RHGRI_015058 [Rhododendron griersonianum]
MSNLDRSLDDIIKMNKKSGGGGGAKPRGGGARNSGSGPGPARRLPNRGASRTAPYAPFRGSRGGGVRAMERFWYGKRQIRTKLTHSRPCEEQLGMATGGMGRADLKSTSWPRPRPEPRWNLRSQKLCVVLNKIELFAEVGDLKRYSIHYDRSGRSKGTAEVVFSRRKDAEAAVKRYNNVQLDGKPMMIEIVGTNIATPATIPPPTIGMFGDQNGAPRRLCVEPGRLRVVTLAIGSGSPIRGDFSSSLSADTRADRGWKGFLGYTKSMAWRAVVDVVEAVAAAAEAAKRDLFYYFLDRSLFLRSIGGFDEVVVDFVKRSDFWVAHSFALQVVRSVGCRT